MIPAPRSGGALRDDEASVALAARRCRVLGHRLAAAEGAVASDAARLPDRWRGPAAVAARRELLAVDSVLDRLPPPLAAAALALAAYALAVGTATRELARLESAYVDAGAREARAAASSAALDGLPAPLRERWRAQQQHDLADELRGLAARREVVLAELSAAARRTAARLHAAAEAALPPSARRAGRLTAGEAALAAALPLLARQRALSVTAGRPGALPARGTPPGLVGGWWAWLTSDEQARLVRDRPAGLGLLVGLPATVLDAANRRVLARDLADLRPADARRRRAALLVAGALGVAQRRADPVTGRPFPVRLLGFSPGAFGGEGRVVVAVGDPDTADNVAYLVPGMGSDLVHMAVGLVGDAARVTAAARRVEPGETTATVGWLGYDAPGLLTVGSGAAAAAGGRLLRRDLLAAASRTVTPHLTVVGHSYGSTTVGAAQRTGPTGAVDVVLLGSPGAGVGRAAALHVPPGHVYVGASSRDPVSYLDRFGPDPSHERFGAVRFQAEDPTRNPSRLALGDHAKYYRSGSESLGNVARVVAGDGADVSRAPYRHELRLRPDGIDADPEADRTPTRVRLGPPVARGAGP